MTILPANGTEEYVEVFMIEVTENAAKELRAYFTDKELAPIRVFLAPGG